MILDIQKFPPHYHTVEPYSHQRHWGDVTWNERRFALFWEMGCGKTKPILDTATRLFLAQQIDGILVVSDKGCYRGWEEELQKHVPSHVPVRVAHWASSLCKAEREKLEQILVAQDDLLDVLLMNVDAFSGERGCRVAAQFLRNHHSLWVIDESTSIKNRKALRTKNIMKLRNFAEYRRIMTGTPATEGPLDLYSQCEFLEPGLLGFTSFTAYKHHYATTHEIVAGSRRWEKIIGYKNLDDLAKRLDTFSSRLLKSDCLDLPEKIYETRDVELTPEQQQAYDNMRRMALLELDQGYVTSTNALTTLTKLQQIVCGHVKRDDGVVIDLPSNRTQVLLDVVEEVRGKVVIWCAFQRDVEVVLKALRGKFEPPTFAVDYYGLTPEHGRESAKHLFATDPDCRFWVGTAASGGKGLNCLIHANTCIYYSNTFSEEDRLQSEDRLHRIGQKNAVTYVDLVAPKTVDERVIKALREKGALQRLILDDLRQLLAS